MIETPPSGCAHTHLPPQKDLDENTVKELTEALKRRLNVFEGGGEDNQYIGSALIELSERTNTPISSPTMEKAITEAIAWKIDTTATSRFPSFAERIRSTPELQKYLLPAFKRSIEKTFSSPRLFETIPLQQRQQIANRLHQLELHKHPQEEEQALELPWRELVTDALAFPTSSTQPILDIAQDLSYRNKDFAIKLRNDIKPVIRWATQPIAKRPPHASKATVAYYNFTGALQRSISIYNRREKHSKEDSSRPAQGSISPSAVPPEAPRETTAEQKKSKLRYSNASFSPEERTKATTAFTETARGNTTRAKHLFSELSRQQIHSNTLWLHALEHFTEHVATMQNTSPRELARLINATENLPYLEGIALDAISLHILDKAHKQTGNSRRHDSMDLILATLRAADLPRHPHRSPQLRPGIWRTAINCLQPPATQKDVAQLCEELINVGEQVPHIACQLKKITDDIWKKAARNNSASPLAEFRKAINSTVRRQKKAQTYCAVPTPAER